MTNGTGNWGDRAFSGAVIGLVLVATFWALFWAPYPLADNIRRDVRPAYVLTVGAAVALTGFWMSRGKKSLRGRLVGMFSGLFWGIAGLVTVSLLTHLVLFGPNKPFGPNVYTSDRDKTVITNFLSSAEFGALIADSEVVSEPTIDRATWDYQGQTTSVWEGVIPWLPSDPPAKKEVLFRVIVFDRETGDTRSIVLSASFTNPGDQLLGFSEVTDEDNISGVGL